MNKKEDGSSSTHVRTASVLAAALFLACCSSVAGAVAPKPFDLQSPGDGATIHDYLPVLKWRDAGKDAVDHYEVWVNGEKVADAKTNSHKAGNTIRNGETSWRVVAVGKDGTKVSCRRKFTFRKESILVTRWGEQVTPENVHPEYPRPQMVRERWRNLNGLWDYAIRPMAEPDAPESFDGKILVPFPIEAGLSGVMVTLGYTNVIWYRRTFEVPRGWAGDRVLLNFEAVDWRTTVWVNGKKIGTHEGGYDPFSFDITDALKRGGKQELVVRVFDPTRSGTQPFGKQVMRNWAKKIHSLFTCTSGIWLTVWLEPVKRNHIESLVMVPDIDKGTLDVTAKCSGDRGTVELVAKDGDTVVARGRGRPGEKITLSIPKPRLWSPITPFLYDLEATLRDGASVDRVESYFGMRKISLGKVDGVAKIFLNNDPLFMQEPLDQGFWPDGIHTHPSDEALRYDIELTKYLGYNATRKHIKIEPRRWYYWTDKLGLLVQQDAVSPGRDEFKKDKSPPQFEHDLVAMIANLYSAPSVYAWVIFNEGWGQHDTARYTELVRKLDPHRLVQQASGWHDKKSGDIVDTHNYKANPKGPKAEPNRASMIGEYGARGLNVEGHRTWPSRMWSGMVDNYSKMTENYLHMLRCVEGEKKAKNLSGAVYSVLTDEEGENCGLVTYDREVFKIDPDKVIQPSRDLWFIPSEFEHESVSAPRSVAPGEVFNVTVTATNRNGKTAMGTIDVYVDGTKAVADDSWVPTGGSQVIDVPLAISEIGPHEVKVGTRTARVTVTDSPGVIDFSGWEGGKTKDVVERVGILRVAYPFPEKGISVRPASFEGTWTSPSRKTGKMVRFTSLAYRTRIVEGEEVVAVVKTDIGQTAEMKLPNGSGMLGLRISGRQARVTLTLRTDNQKMHAPEVIGLKLKFGVGR
jgi:hypothetical protein